MLRDMTMISFEVPRKIRSRSIDVHPTEKALVVNYELEALILGDLGDPLLGDRKECQKIIRLKSLNEETDCSALAKEVVEKCSLIHPTKLDEVEQLIYYLQNRKDASLTNIYHLVGLCVDREETSRPSSSGSGTESPNSNSGVLVEKANINHIESYVELLYEDIPDKVNGSALILQLARNPDNLEELGSNESVLSALSRVLREDWKKSIELSTNIVYIFFCFSTYSQFHHVILQYKSPSLTVFDPKEELHKTKEDVEKMSRKFHSLIKKQDQLLRVSFYLLLNVAEDTKVEDKMRRKNVVGMLTKTLDRNNIDLLILVLTFLKKLAIFRENVDDMANLNVVEKLPRVLMMNHPDLIHITLKLLLNLSFDTLLRERMVRVGFLPKLVSLLSDQRHEAIVLRILYHMSMDDRCKSMFTYTECVPMAMSMLLDSSEEEANLELIALCINLAINKRNAQMMVENNRLQNLMTRAFRNQDSLLMKMLRNIAQHDSTKQSFVEFVGDIAKAIGVCENEDFVVECVGVLGNMTLPDLDFSQLMQRFNLIPWIFNVLVPSRRDDDLVLEVVVFLGTAAADEGCATLLCKADVLLSLIELLKAKQEDDEMVLQIIYVFFVVSRHVATREYLIRETEAPAYLIDLMHDKNTHIRKVCNMCLDIIVDWDKDWAERIKLEKFRWHNSQWLEMVENSALDSTSFDKASTLDNELPAYLEDDIMQHTLLFPSGRFNT
uniref:Kinesin-associated protein 3 n=1 Tax=Timema monikensis TaxID=170555 RepID=A0A7R9E3D2_9NEOP|nr:unnamed protein product [Timema monikensis]